MSGALHESGRRDNRDSPKGLAAQMANHASYSDVAALWPSARGTQPRLRYRGPECDRTKEECLDNPAAALVTTMVHRSGDRSKDQLGEGETAMVREFKFEVGPVAEQLDRILQMELAGVIYYTHYSFMVYGHARIPITSWLRENATELLTHAQEAGEMIMRLHKGRLSASRRSPSRGTIPLTKL